MQFTIISGTSLLRAYRATLNLSLDYVAKKIGKHQSFLSKIESGQKRPSIDTLKDLAEIYNLNNTQHAELLSSFDYHEVSPLITFKTYGKEDNLNNMDKKNPTNEADTLVQGMNINIDPVKTPVLYADAVFIRANENGIGLDFVQQIGGSNQYTAVSRIGVSREHAAKLIEHLEGVIRSTSQQNNSSKKEA